MERLKSSVPEHLKIAVANGTLGNLTETSSSILDWFLNLQQFHEMVRELVDPEATRCGKNKDTALELKQIGNQYFLSGDHDKALNCYSQALRVAPVDADDKEKNLVATLYVNRAAVLRVGQKIGLLMECLRDCNPAIQISLCYAKAWYRRGKTNISLGNFEDAMFDFTIAKDMESSLGGNRQMESEMKILLEHHKTTISTPVPHNANHLASLVKEHHLSNVPYHIELKCVMTPHKGRGMISKCDIPLTSIVHVEDPYSVLRVGQGIYLSGSLFNHSCKPNIHAYFLSRKLFVRATELVAEACPLELSYGPEVGKLNCNDRVRFLEVEYFFKCHCRGCSEVNIPELLMDGFCCTNPNCSGVVLDHNVVDKNSNVDINDVAGLLVESKNISVHVTPGSCLKCGKYCDLEYSYATLKKTSIYIRRLQGSVVSGEVSVTTLSDALKSLDVLKSILHACNKGIAEVEDRIAQASCLLGDLLAARKHCKASIEILEKLYGPSHIVIGYELVKFSSIQLAMGDSTVVDSINRLRLLFSLHYGFHAYMMFPELQYLKNDNTA